MPLNSRRVGDDRGHDRSLKDQFSLKCHRAKTLDGLLARIAASPAASYQTLSSVVLSTALPIFYFRSYFVSAILGRSPSTDRRWW